MKTKKYNDDYKFTDAKIVSETFEKLKNMTPENRNLFLRRITDKYINNISEDISFWISMYDYCQHIKYINKEAYFITNNKEFMEFIDLLKIRINNIKVISVEEFAKQMK